MLFRLILNNSISIYKIIQKYSEIVCPFEIFALYLHTETINKNIMDKKEKLMDYLSSLKWVMCGVFAVVYGLGYFTVRPVETHSEFLFLISMFIFAFIGYATGLGIGNTVKKYLD